MTNIQTYEFQNDVRYYVSRGMSESESKRYVKYWYSQRKKDENEVQNVSHLETRSKIGEDNED